MAKKKFTISYTVKLLKLILARPLPIYFILDHF